MSTKTYQPSKQTIQRNWHLVDAKGQILGRLATEVAKLLSGKRKIVFAPHVDSGDHVVVINAEGIRITGNNKPTQKIDFRHSGYPGGDTMTPYNLFLEKKPARAVELAISGMLPKTRLRKRQMARLHVFRKNTHPYGGHFAAKEQAAKDKASQQTETVGA
jgi:large subunit ribosomal protein L13